VTVRLYNTLTRAKEPFSSDGTVTLYVCGVTPYDTTHLGHARTYVVFDVLVRHLMNHGMTVDYVQNITDVDDSILARAAQLDESFEELGDRYTAVYLEDVAALGMLPARAYPRATEAIPEIQELIRRLLATGHAYRVDGEVFFSVGSIPTYGELSRLDRARMLEIETAQDGSTVADARKRDPLDLLLWRVAAPDEPAWVSPWGPGRPGWHIECSALALRHLGKQVDVHGGGSDLVFPHHEAEIAQSEAVTGVRPFVRYWVHVEMARLHGEKMSKSRGNMVFVRDLLASHPPDGVRLYLLAAHYRAPLDYDEGSLRECSSAARRLATAARVRASTTGSEEEADSWQRRFVAALDDDLDTPTATGVLGDMADVVLEGGHASYQMRRTLRSLAGRLGLSLEARTPDVSGPRR
jgi:L-cysteine:1D-myo-inositol 2-amino-2-deoxy-alpha-D-glucopyranoside ligase